MFVSGSFFVPRKGFIIMRKNIRFLTKASIIAAIYVVLTLISALFGLASSAVQIRISEALCILPIYSTAAIPGVAIGCFISNIICGGTIYDIVFGTIATFVGAVGAYLVRKFPYISSLPTILSNVVIIPVVLISSGVGGWNLFPYFVATVGLGEIIACGILGTVLIVYLKKHPSSRKMLFGNDI